MHDALPILADGDEVLIKLIVGGVIAIFWVIAQVAGAIKKKPQKTLPPSRPMPSPQQRPRPRPAGSLPTPPPMRLPEQVRLPEQYQRPIPAPAPMQTRQVPPMPKTVKRPRPRPVAIQQPVQAPPVVQQRLRPALSQPAEPQAPAAPILPRRQMVDALMRPRNLKKAFIITELLGPPVALRPPRDE